MNRFTPMLAGHWSTLRRSTTARMAGLATLALALLSFFEIDDALGQLWQAHTTPAQIRERSIWLPNYQFVERLHLPGIQENASDIIYIAERKSYFVAVNGPPQLYEYSEDFALKAHYDLQGFEDTEALAYDGNGNLLIGEERRQSVVTLPLSQLDRPIVRSELGNLIIATKADNNRGLEGMAFDPASQVLFASREQRPMRLFEVAGAVQPSNAMVYQAAVSTLGVQRLRMDDVSAMHYDLQSRHLLVLSDESQLLAELDSGYYPISFMDLEAGFNGLDQDVPQAEGVTLGPQRELLIVSEPNLLYRYRLKEE